MVGTDHREAALEQLLRDVETMKVQGQRLKAIHVLQPLVCLFFASIIGWYVWHGLPVHYIPEGGPGYSKPGVLPEAMARDFAERFARARFTFTPDTFKLAIEECLRWVHPELRVRFKVDAEEEERRVRKEQLSSQVHFTQRQVTPGRRDTAKVVLLGVRSVWVGEGLLREEPLRAEVTLVPWFAPGLAGHLVVARSWFSPVLSATEK
jgi:hypothetical protein